MAVGVGPEPGSRLGDLTEERVRIKAGDTVRCLSANGPPGRGDAAVIIQDGVVEVEEDSTKVLAAHGPGSYTTRDC